MIRAREGNLSDPCLDKTDRSSRVSYLFELGWSSANAVHTDCHFQSGLSFWQDDFPLQLEEELSGQTSGFSAKCSFEAGELFSEPAKQELIHSPVDKFVRQSVGRQTVHPRVGRFYPKRFIAGVNGISSHDVAPMRLTRVEEQLDIDLNHPLVYHQTSLTARIVDIKSAGRQGGLSHNVTELVTMNGPGMQARWKTRPTDFWSDAPFERADGRRDSVFYQTPRFVDHIDRCASKQIAELYRDLLSDGDVVLDLMSSWNSHLPNELGLSELLGLGLNREELASNTRLDGYVIHDLNENTKLPFDSNKFNAVICTVSIEYLARPLDVFAEIYRVLEPGGRFIVTFSNRWFPPKAINLWAHLHDFERMGLVLEYFMLGGQFTNLHTWSMRGLPRPPDDKYADRLKASDPVFAVWGDKNI